MTKILVIGASGLLGQYLMEAGEGMGLQMSGTYNDTSPGVTGVWLRMNISDPNSVQSGLDLCQPDMVILSAAMTNVDQCEREPGKAYSINMEGTLNVATACKAMGVKLVYVSTDYVFNGLKGARYHEFESPDPLSVYARSKLEGERVTMDANKDNLVCRVSVVYGWNRMSDKGNFVTWVIGSLKKGQTIRLFRDQWVSPTYAPVAAKDILELAIKGAKGIFHTNGPDCLNRYEIGLLIAEAFDLDQRLIEPINTEEMPMLAVRPRVSCLAVDLVESELERPMCGLRQGLEDMRQRIP